MFAFDELFSLKDKTALVTGGGAGLGRICTQALLSAGARVLICSRKAEVCAAAADEMSAIGPCEGFGGSVDSEAGVMALAQEVGRRADRLDILVNNAGVTWGAEFDAFPWKGWDKVMNVNLTGLFILTQQLMPLLLAAARPEAPARVVNMGSITGTQPIGDRAYSYAVSKAAVHHLTRILARELAARHVTVNAIAPGPFESRMTAFALASEAGREHAARAIPMGRLGQPADLAGALLFLTSRAGAYTTGAILPADGGMSADAQESLWLATGA